MYTEKDREILHFPNSTIRVDPLELRRKLLIHTNGQFHQFVQDFNDENELASALAEDALVAAVRSALSLKPAAEKGGASDASVMEYLSFYLEWLSAPAQPSINLSLTSSPCSDCPPPHSTT